MENKIWLIVNMTIYDSDYYEDVTENIAIFSTFEGAKQFVDDSKSLMQENYSIIEETLDSKSIVKYYGYYIDWHMNDLLHPSTQKQIFYDWRPHKLIESSFNTLLNIPRSISAISSESMEHAEQLAMEEYLKLQNQSKSS